MPFGQCKLCCNVGKFARAHLVPKAFYEFRGGIGPHYIFSNKSDSRPKKSPAGIYDEELICRECEARLAYLDDYAAKMLKPWPRRSQLLRDESGLIIRVPGESTGGYSIIGVNVDRLKLFFSFLAWRCATTVREEFSIKLPADKILRLEKSLTSTDPSIADLFIIGSRYSNRNWKATFSPWPRAPKVGQPINFVMYGLRFLIHFEPPDVPSELLLGHNPNWPIIFDEFKGSRLHQVALSMARKHGGPWARLKSRQMSA